MAFGQVKSQFHEGKRSEIPTASELDTPSGYHQAKDISEIIIGAAILFKNLSRGDSLSELFVQEVDPNAMEVGGKLTKSLANKKLKFLRQPVYVLDDPKPE